MMNNPQENRQAQCYQNRWWEVELARKEQRIVELDEALRALACEYEYQVCADEHYDKAMAVANSTGKDA